MGRSGGFRPPIAPLSRHERDGGSPISAHPPILPEVLRLAGLQRRPGDAAARQSKHLNLSAIYPKDLSFSEKKWPILSRERLRVLEYTLTERPDCLTNRDQLISSIVRSTPVDQQRGIKSVLTVVLINSEK